MQLLRTPAGGVRGKIHRVEGLTHTHTTREQSSPLGSHELNWPWRRLENQSPETPRSLKAVGGVKEEWRTEGSKEQMKG